MLGSVIMEVFSISESLFALYFLYVSGVLTTLCVLTGLVMMDG